MTKALCLQREGGRQIIFVEWVGICLEKKRDVFKTTCNSSTWAAEAEEEDNDWGLGYPGLNREWHVSQDNYVSDPIPNPQIKM